MVAAVVVLAVIEVSLERERVCTFVRECVCACIWDRVCMCVHADLAIYFFDFHRFGGSGGGGGDGGGGGGGGGIGGDRGNISWDVTPLTDSSIFPFIINERV